MNKKKSNFRFNFFQRTLLYFLIGITCVSIDFLLFINLAKLIGPYYSNPFAYIIASFCSYNLNKRFTFKSKNAKLSFVRFFTIIIIGLGISQLFIIIGIQFLSKLFNLSSIKFFAMVLSISFQYFGNSFFGTKSMK